MRRHLSLFALTTAMLAVAVAVVGCGTSRSILYAGVSPASGAIGTPRHVVTDAEARRAGRTVPAFWVTQLPGGKLGPASSLSPRDFRSRLAHAASRYGFSVKRVRFIKTRGQSAPFVIVETKNYLAFARATSALTKSLDPLTHRLNRSTGSPFRTFPGFLLEAQDERGVPFLIVDIFPSGGGQWARSDQLYPGPHG